MKVAILGTGANAYAAYRALDESNHEVTVFDYGFSDLAGTYKLPGAAGKDHEYAFNSFFLPEVFKTSSNLENKVAGSAAYGGWSNVWGATIFSLTQEEMLHWDLNTNVLLEHQEKICEKIQLFNLKPNNDLIAAKVGISRHVHSQNRHLVSPDCLQISNLAIAKESLSPATGCIKCGDCLIGCKWGHIWSSRLGWEDLKSKENVTFELGVWVQEVTEAGDKVVVKCQRNGAGEDFIFDKVFVALGSYQTAALMLRSNVCKLVRIKDSPMFIAPFFLPFLKKTTPSRPGITLSSAFASTTFSVSKSNSLKHDFFAQVYGYSEELELKIVSQVGLARVLPSFLRRAILSRVGIAMCFFDQSFGGSIESKLTSDNEVEFTPVFNRQNRCLLSKLARKNLYKFKFIAIPFIGQISKVGLGYHSGASFPHSTSPNRSGENYSDYLGRPNGLKNTHLVDVSVFPRLGSSPPTFNSMANAHRIAQEATKE
jgi:hypothetical protein